MNTPARKSQIGWWGLTLTLSIFAGLVVAVQSSNLFPVPETKFWDLKEMNMKVHSGRRLAPFQLCSGCTCCSGQAAKNVCTTSSCCYSITCGLPDKPYGVCAFTPKTCNCSSCGSATTTMNLPVATTVFQNP